MVKGTPLQNSHTHANNAKVWRAYVQKKNVALAQPYHEGKSFSKFGKCLPSGLGGDKGTDGRTDRQTDGGVHNIPITKAWG